MRSILQHVPESSVPTLIVGVLTIVALSTFEWLRPRWPAPLIVIGAAIAAVAMFGLQERGIELVGAIPVGPPPLTLRALGPASNMWAAAMGIALMSFAETAAVGRAFIRSDEPTLRPNRELLATGVGNLVGAFTGSMPAGGGMSQTALNRMTGAQSHVVARDSDHDVVDDALLVALCRPHAARGAGRHSDRLLGRPDQAGGVP